MPIEPKSYALRGKSKSLLTVSLFYEPWAIQDDHLRAQDIHPVFTFANEREGYISVRKTFLEEGDPTGVKWAEKWLEGVNHLNRLMQAPWFAEVFETLQAECEQMLQAEALRKIRAISDGSSPAAFQAAKYIASKEWKQKHGRGRPSKAELSGALKREMEKVSQEDADMARITNKPQLKVVS